MAELSRRYGFVPAYASGIANEIKPNLDNYKSPSDLDNIEIFGEPSQMDLHNNGSGRGAAASGGPVNVRRYKRDDGTKVDAHSRSAPALHGR